VSAAADLVFIITGRVNVIVIKAGPIVAPVCARITFRPGAMACIHAFYTVGRPILADCGTGGIWAKTLALGGRTALQIIWNVITLNRIPVTPSQKE